MSLLVFSDLDGTLLDHHSYSWAPARPGLERLQALDAGLVLASSKTASEIRPLQQEIGCAAFPAIVENGAGILWPDADTSTQDDADYCKLRQVLNDLDQAFLGVSGFIGFGDMSVEEVAAATGLTEGCATLAKQRCFSEPGLWHGSAQKLETFLAALRKQGVQARSGGRFLTLSFGQTKADAMAVIIKALQPSSTIALGDAPNDIEMIERADWGVLVANPQAPAIAPLHGEQKGRIIRTTKPGPAGWADAIMHITAHRKDL